MNQIILCKVIQKNTIRIKKLHIMKKMSKIYKYDIYHKTQEVLIN